MVYKKLNTSVYKKVNKRKIVHSVLQTLNQFYCKIDYKFTASCSIGIFCLKSGFNCNLISRNKIRVQLAKLNIKTTLTSLNVGII